MTGTHRAEREDGSTVRARELKFARGGFELFVPDLVARPGEISIVTGSSGSGKTTLLSLLSGLIPADSGQVVINDESVQGRDGAPHPGMVVALAARALVGSLTAGENLMLALQVERVPGQIAEERVTDALARLDVGDLADRRIGELSGGQVQRVSVARALAVGADVLLLDEPTSELDGASRELTLSALCAEADRGATVIMSTHDTEDITYDARVHLDEGKVIPLP